MEENKTTNKTGATVNLTADASGVPEAKKTQPEEAPKHWYIAVVPRMKEKVTAETLTRNNYESFVPIQQEKKIWNNGRKRIIDRILIPSRVFVHITEAERLLTMKLNICNKFMVDYGRRVSATRHAVAIVPDHEMQRFMDVVANNPTPVEISEVPLVKGEKVKVLYGCLKDMEGILVKDQNSKSRIYVDFGIIGSASTEIDPEWVQRC